MEENKENWEKIAEVLYQQLLIADSCIKYESLGAHRKTLMYDIGKAIKIYQNNKNNKK